MVPRHTLTTSTAKCFDSFFSLQNSNDENRTGLTKMDETQKEKAKFNSASLRVWCLHHSTPKLSERPPCFFPYLSMQLCVTSTTNANIRFAFPLRAACLSTICTFPSQRCTRYCTSPPLSVNRCPSFALPRSKHTVFYLKMEFDSFHNVAYCDRVLWGASISAWCLQ